MENHTKNKLEILHYCVYNISSAFAWIRILRKENAPMKYEIAELEIVLFENEDIVTDSDIEGPKVEV